MDSQFRSILDDALQYWERARLAYNLVLAAVVALWVLLTWPHFRPALNFASLGLMFILAVLANICFCAAYIPDFALQYSSWQQQWRRRRWLLWLIGTLFAVAITNYWIADEIYPFV